MCRYLPGKDCHGRKLPMCLFGTIPSNRCLSNCLLPSKSTFSIEVQATEKPCHCEAAFMPTWQSVPLNVLNIWEISIKTEVLRIRIATATGGLAMTMRNLMPYS